MSQLLFSLGECCDLCRCSRTCPRCRLKGDTGTQEALLWLRLLPTPITTTCTSCFSARFLRVSLQMGLLSTAHSTVDILSRTCLRLYLTFCNLLSSLSLVVEIYPCWSMPCIFNSLAAGFNIKFFWMHLIFTRALLQEQKGVVTHGPGGIFHWEWAGGQVVSPQPPRHDRSSPNWLLSPLMICRRPMGLERRGGLRQASSCELDCEVPAHVPVTGETGTLLGSY